VTSEEQYYDPMTQIQHYTRHRIFLPNILAEGPCLQARG
jgi:hypothetical protein